MREAGEGVAGAAEAVVAGMAEIWVDCGIECLDEDKRDGDIITLRVIGSRGLGARKRRKRSSRTEDHSISMSAGAYGTMVSVGSEDDEREEGRTFYDTKEKEERKEWG